MAMKLKMGKLLVKMTTRKPPKPNHIKRNPKRTKTRVKRRRKVRGRSLKRRKNKRKKDPKARREVSKVDQNLRSVLSIESPPVAGIEIGMRTEDIEGTHALAVTQETDIHVFVVGVIQDHVQGPGRVQEEKETVFQISVIRLRENGSLKLHVAMLCTLCRMVAFHLVWSKNSW